MSASTDTFNLFAASFESGTSCTPMGWTMVDLTEQTGVYFHIDDYSGLEGFGLTPLDGAKSLWCGARPSASPVMCSYLTLPGYGNHWDQAWCTKNCIPVNGALDVSFVARFDTEPGHDFVTLEYTTDCSSEYGWTVIDEWSGSVPYLEHNASYDLGVGAGPVRVRLHFQSDGYGSDEDGLWQTTGAVHFDDLVVEGVPWENFEDEQVGSTSSNDWRAYAPDGYGSYLSLFSGGALVDEDPCTNNLSCVWAAIQNSTYNYACGGFPLQAAVPFVNPEGQYLKNEIWSPTIPLTGSGSAVLLEFSVYRDLPLDNLVFYVWHVRSVGAGGCPGPWKDRGTVYYSDTKDWYRHVERVGDLLDLGNATGMQVALGVWDMRDVWGGVYGTGFCHSQAPLFDSVQVKRVAVVGPQWSVKDIELFQDSFPGDGTASGTVRADMAKDINPSSNPAILPGDSAVVTVADPELGLMDDFVSGGKAVHCYVRVLHAGQPDKSGPDLVDDPRWSYVDDVAANGVAWSRIHCDQALVGGHPVQDRFCVDLNDNLFVPGDTVLYFFGAQNAYGEATYFAGSGAVDNIDVAAANALEFTCLPARALTAGARILYVNGAGDESSRLAIETALSQLGVLSEVDRYDVLGPSWDAGNRLASRVTSVYSQLLPFYDVILWECGDVPVTLGGGPGSSIKEDDYGLLAAFLESLDRPHGVCLSGDDVAEKLAMGSSSSSASFMSTYIPYTLTTGDHRTAYGVSPLVVGSPWGTFSNDTFYVSGGCPVLSDFDVMDPTGSSVMEAGYGSPATVNGAIIANWTSNGASVNVGVLLSGFRFDAVDNTGGGVYRTAYMDALLLSLNVSSLGGPAPPPPPSHNIIHVDANATGTGSGWSWQDAFTNLQTALAFAVPGNEIWVAEGIYRPAIGYDRTAAFHLKNGVKVYGGFAGTESALSERDLSLHASVLSGDIGVVGNNADNCYHVVSGSGNDATAVLDGFTVTEGNANGPSPDDSGGGIYITNGNPTIQNVIVIGNAAATRGGGIMCDGSSSFVNVLVRENIAPEGGGVAATSGTPVFTNATFTQNVAYGQGGAVYIDMSFPAFRNSILWDDLATVAGNEIYSATILPFSLEYSLVSPGGIAGSSIGTNNLSTDPQFVKPGVGDLRLRIGSPALNAGLNSVVSGVPTDLNSQPRIAEGTVDLGAYEGGVTVRVLYVDGDAAGNNDGTSWVDAYTNLQDAIAAAAGVGEIWVAEGVYYPTSGTDRNISFQLPPNFAIFGGFAGTETLLQQRDVSTHVTVLSGDIGIADEPLDNSFHVLSAALVDSNTVVDGFTVRDGCANGAGDQSGGGMFNDSSAPCLRNMVFQDNTALNGGGAMFNQNSRPKLVNIRFLDNTSSTDGGGIYNQTSSPTLVNVMFFQNSANGGGGGGVYNSASSPKLANVTFSGNQAAPLPSNSGGAAIHNVDSYPSLINCVLWGDVTSESTPEIYDDLDHPSSTVLSHSLVQGLGGCIGCVDQGENIDADPVFKNAAVGDLRLKNFGSP
ncbi:MAG TPA: choice-of-anchor Q domain-containing protein, partial [Candidatus Krumholzibacteria bacterium]|nr:choice-of-anchor Q domain-containing protein [Candidatus Krumholzibacteria bacterium]